MSSGGLSVGGPQPAHPQQTDNRSSLGVSPSPVVGTPSTPAPPASGKSSRKRGRPPGGAKKGARTGSPNTTSTPPDLAQKVEPGAGGMMLPPNSTAPSRNLVSPSGVGANVASPNLGSQSARGSEADWIKQLGSGLQNQGSNCDGAIGAMGGSNIGQGRQNIYCPPLESGITFGDFATTDDDFSNILDGTDFNAINMPMHDSFDLEGMPDTKRQK
eukprot:jgi/Botrbrau1/11259/Bobra.0038s0031.1